MSQMCRSGESITWVLQELLKHSSHMRSSIVSHWEEPRAQACGLFMGLRISSWKLIAVRLPLAYSPPKKHHPTPFFDLLSTGPAVWYYRQQSTLHDLSRLCAQGEPFSGKYQMSCTVLDSEYNTCLWTLGPNVLACLLVASPCSEHYTDRQSKPCHSSHWCAILNELPFLSHWCWCYHETVSLLIPLNVLVSQSSDPLPVKSLIKRTHCSAILCQYLCFSHNRRYFANHALLTIIGNYFRRQGEIFPRNALTQMLAASLLLNTFCFLTDCLANTPSVSVCYWFEILDCLKCKHTSYILEKIVFCTSHFGESTRFSLFYLRYNCNKRP